MKDRSNVPFTLQIQWAISQSAAPREIKHMIMVMAMEANSATGRAYYSQATIADHMGCTARTVRRYQSELAQLPDLPVAIERTRRGGKDGKGRSSDEWQLVLKRTTVSLSDDAPSGQPCPLEPTRSGHIDPVTPRAEADKHDTRSGQKRTSEADTAVLRSTEGSTELDLRSSSAPRKPRKRGEVAPVPGVHVLKLHYVEQYKLHRGIEPKLSPHQWSRAMKAFGVLITTHGLDDAKIIVSKALSDAYSRRIQPWLLVDDALVWLGKQPKPNGKKPEVQRGGPDPNSYGREAPWLNEPSSSPDHSRAREATS